MNQYLIPFTDNDMPENGDWVCYNALVKHPDYRQLIPAKCHNKQGTILV